MAPVCPLVPPRNISLLPPPPICLQVLKDFSDGAIFSWRLTSPTSDFQMLRGSCHSHGPVFSFWVHTEPTRELYRMLVSGCQSPRRCDLTVLWCSLASSKACQVASLCSQG